jgi:hypothetical protein
MMDYDYDDGRRGAAGGITIMMITVAILLVVASILILT